MINLSLFKKSIPTISAEVFKKAEMEGFITVISVAKEINAIFAKALQNPFKKGKVSIDAIKKRVGELSKAIIVDIVDGKRVEKIMHFIPNNSVIIEKAYGGRSARLGETRVWGGKTYKKTAADRWEYVGVSGKKTLSDSEAADFEHTYSKVQAEIYANGGVALTKKEESRPMTVTPEKFKTLDTRNKQWVFDKLDSLEGHYLKSGNKGEAFDVAIKTRELINTLAPGEAGKYRSVKPTNKGEESKTTSKSKPKVDLSAGDILVTSNGKEIEVRTVNREGVEVKDEEGHITKKSWKEMESYVPVPKKNEKGLGEVGAIEHYEEWFDDSSRPGLYRDDANLEAYKKRYNVDDQSIEEIKLQVSPIQAKKEAAVSKRVNHPSFSSAVQEASRETEAKGYEIDEDDWFREVSTGPGKPKNGSTTRMTIGLSKKGKPVKEALHIQVFDRGTKENSYELNYYVS